MNGLHYQIRLEPDLERFCFRGLTAVSAGDATLIVDDTILLNAHELSIEYCTVNGVPAEYDLNSSQQLLAIHFPQPQPDNGPFTVHISYYGQINDRYAGLYRSRYEHNGQEKWLASSQFQASDARRVFPCFDHPARKGTFDLSLLLDRELTAVSNTEVAEVIPQENGKKLIRFARTPKMSPYLVFIGIGELEFVEAEYDHFDLRVVTTAGKSQYGCFALDMAAKSLEFCEGYTSIEYPLTKCDLIAVPDSIGAMENFGAIRHSENLLLVYPDSTSQADRVRIGSIIAHEISHMWFGNLVSLADWKYLWLNEAFATFFTFVIPDHSNPEWNVWSDFAAEAMQVALERDALLDTIPIELSPGQSLEGDPAPTPSSAPIIYNKGAAVLRMLSSLVGQESFKKGLHHYLQSYQYDSATSSQFWECFDLAAGRDNHDFSGAWIYQPGFPLVTAKRKEDRVHLSQHRFTFSPFDSGERWVVPVELLLVRQGYQIEVRSVLLEEEETAVAIPPDTIAYKLNHDQTGFYRVRYAESDLSALGPLVKRQQLSALDSFGLQNDLFALVRRGDYLLDAYLDYIETYYLEEIRSLPLNDIANNLLAVYLLLPQRRKQVAHIGRALCENALDAIGMAPQQWDSHQTSLLRSNLLWTACIFGSARAVQFGRAAFSDLLAGKRVEADISSTVLKLGAAIHDKAFDFLMDCVTSGGLAEAEMTSFLEAMGNFQEEERLRQALDANLAITPKNLRITVLLAAAQNPAATNLLWDWFVENSAALRILHPAQMERLLVGLVPVCGLGREAEVTAFCFAFAAENARAVDSIKMALEKLEINSRLCDRETGLIV